MAKTNKKDEFPKVKYKLVNGNGWTLCDSWEKVCEEVKFYKTDPHFKELKRFQPQYVVKITEEYIELD
jgi:hypothetical protein